MLPKEEGLHRIATFMKPKVTWLVAHGLAKLALASEEEHLWTSNFWSYDFLSNIQTCVIAEQGY
jgi:hypothetical protein